MAQSMTNHPRKRLSPKKRKAKLLEWQRHGRWLRRGRVRVDWNQIPDMDAEVIAVPRAVTNKAARFLNDQRIAFWQLGPLDRVCGRIDHHN